jgi:hypothetical protein
MNTETNRAQQEMDQARINYYRCVAGSHTIFWISAIVYGLYKFTNWIIN